MSASWIIVRIDHFFLLRLTQHAGHVANGKLTVVLHYRGRTNHSIDTARHPARIEHSGVVKPRVSAEIEC